MSTLLTWQEHTAGGRPQGGTIAETVFPEVVNIVSKRRPLLSMLSSVSVDNTFVESQSDSYATRGHNAILEGLPATDYNLTQPARHFTHVQSLYKGGKVSDENRLVRHYNGDPYSYQVAKTLQELLNDLEHALHRGSAVTGATDAARQFAGLLNIPPTGASGTFTSLSGVTLSEAVFLNLIQVFRNQQLDVDVNTVFVNMWLKRSISEFSTKVTRNVDVAAKRQALVIEQHESDVGTLDILYSEDQLTGNLITHMSNSMSFIDRGMFKVGWLRMPMVEDLPRDGLRDRFQTNGMCTLIYGHSKALGGASGLLPMITTT